MVENKHRNSGMAFSWRIRIFSFVAVGLSATVACQTTGVEVDVVPDPARDSSYIEIVENHTRQASVYNNFETKVLMHVTYLNPQTKAALRARLNRVGEYADHPILSGSDGKTAFLVSLYTPELDMVDLHHRDVWDIVLKHVGPPQRPEAIMRLSKERQLDRFFPFVSTWSHEFLVVFGADTSATDVSLSLSNIVAKVTLDW